MIAFDILLALFLALAIVGIASGKPISGRDIAVCVGAASLTICVQLLAEGPRVQLLPAYALTATLATIAVVGCVLDRKGRVHDRRSRLATWAGASGAAAMLILTILLCAFFPRFEFTKPTGAYAIGTRELRLVDRTRLEHRTPQTDDFRELLVRISYPAQEGVSKRHPTLRIPHVGIMGLSQLWPEALSGIATRWGTVATHARVDAPVVSSSESFPVLIFSHGLGGFPEQNSDLVEEFVSRGYVVVAINHPYLSGHYVASNGRAVTTDVGRRANSIPTTERQIDKLLHARRRLWSARTVEAMVPMIETVESVIPEQLTVLEEGMQLASADQRFVIDALADLNGEQGFLARRLNLASVGVMGMSLGGSASVQTCAHDARCTAGVNMDGFKESTIRLPPLTTPFMHLGSEHNFTGLIVHERSRDESYFVRIAGASHMNYTDISLGAPLLKTVGLLGDIDGQRMTFITRKYVTGFFDRHFDRRATSLIDASEEAGVDFRLKPRGSTSAATQ